MKHYIYLFLAIVTVFAACKKDNDRVFDESPDARLTKALTAYQTQLSGAPNGWKGVISTKSGSVFGFYLKFNDSNRVKMVMDFDSTSAVTLKESSYRLKALQQPSLIFDTYTYFHVLADPNGTISGGNTGEGLLSDFEFYFDSTATQTSDTINLVGRMNGSTAKLIKATAAEATGYTTGQYNITKFTTAYGKILEYFKRLTIGTQSYELLLNTDTKTVIFNSLDATGNLQTFSSKFYFTLSGIGLVTPFNTGTVVISELTNVNFVSATNVIETTINGTVYKMQGAIAPLKTDLGAPYAWWNFSVATGDYYYSPKGFHKDGIDDYYGVTKIANYAYMLFWAKYNISGTQYYDAFCALLTTNAFLGQATYSPNPPPATSTTITTFTTDGRIIFKSLGSFGSATSIPNTTVRTQIIEASGYYLVKIGTNSYDMVSAKDARSWISWLF